MLLVKTFVAPSPIAGSGLFAAEDIPEGAVIWNFVPGFDRMYRPAEVQRLPSIARQYIYEYAYLHNGLYILCTDNARFTNHSEQPNGVGREASIAARLIRAGEEIVEDYREWCDDTRHFPFVKGLAHAVAQGERRPREVSVADLY